MRLPAMVGVVVLEEANLTLAASDSEPSATVTLRNTPSLVTT